MILVAQEGEFLIRNQIMKKLLFLGMICGLMNGAWANADKTEDWQKTVTSPMSCTVKAEQGNVSLHVELVNPPEQELKSTTDETGRSRYVWKGKKLPYGFYEGRSIVTKFELVWDGKKIVIPERFWNDVSGLILEFSSLDVKKLEGEEWRKAHVFLEQMRHPRLSLSADGGTVFIEWMNPGECCDTMMTLRWMVSRSGTVLRHRYAPPDMCGKM